jgi:Protein of unknown function (DUF760)
MFNPEFLTTDSDAVNGNPLIQYLQEQSPDVLQRVARSASPEIQDIIRHNVQGLLGMLPGEQFEVRIQTSRDNLAGLLASAMMTGYFLRQMEQRMELETALIGSGDSNSEADPGPLTPAPRCQRGLSPSPARWACLSFEFLHGRGRSSAT